MTKDGPTGARTAESLARRLRVARQAAGLTQAQAAAELGVSRPLLIAIEKGTRTATAGELARLAELYQTSLGELLRPGAPPEAISTRLRAVMPADQRDRAELDAAVTQLQARADDYLDLLRLAGAEPPGGPEPARAVRAADPRRAEDLAGAERNRLGLGDGPVRPLREVLEIEVGLRIFLLPLPPAVAGLFVPAEPLGGCVAVNSRHPAARRRWTMAHEYAHYLAGRDRAEVTQLTYQRQPAHERFADEFAASFLMPRSGLSRRLHELQRTATGRFAPAAAVQLAHAYEVSVQALSDRLEDLGLTPAGTWESQLERAFARQLAGQLPEAGQPAPAVDAFPLHYRTLAAQLFADEQITEAQLARYLGTDLVGARLAFAQMTETADVTPDGSAQILRLAGAAG